MGPTAAGKTALAIQLARQYHTEIVSADSRQFYREMTIGTAKPAPDELKEVKHHLINSLSVFEDYNAGRFETDALECILDVFSRSNFAVLCGGSGLYVDLVCRGADDLPPGNAALRAELAKLLEENGIGALQSKLRELDPEYFNRVDLQNPHRLIRAIEVCIGTGKKYSELRTEKRERRPFKIIRVGLEDERENIYRRIDERVDRMMHDGLLREVQSLFEARRLNALQAVGYRELFEFMEGKFSLEEAVRRIKQHTRNYAKRQWTWFRRDKEIKWFRPGAEGRVIDYINAIIAGRTDEAN